MKNKAQIGGWGALLSIAVVMALFGLIVTISSGVQQDVTDDKVTGETACGTNSTGGSGGTILYTACSKAYDVGVASLAGSLALANKQSTLVTAGIGIFILSLLIGGFALYKVM